MESQINNNIHPVDEVDELRQQLAQFKLRLDQQEIINDRLMRHTMNARISIFTKMLYTLKFNNDVLAESAMKGYTNATDAADYLVKKGMPFRDAHSVIGRLVLLCLDKNCAIEDLSIAELKELSELFDEDVYDAISLKTCVERRMTKGAPGEIRKSI